jgi:hypothetical protein
VLTLFVESLIFYYVAKTKNQNMQAPKYAKILGSRTGPYGAFEEIEILELPDSFGPGDRVEIDLAKRASINAISVEYAVADFGSAKIIAISAHFEVIERPESTDYTSILGLSHEF